MAKTIVGIEITEESVRAAELSRGRKPVLVAAGEVPLPPGAAKDSEVLDPEAVELAVRQLWSQAGISGHSAVLGVANRRILVREHSAPAMRADLLKATLPYEVSELLPVPPEQAILDFYPIAEAEGQVHGLLVAAVTEPIETLIATLEKAKVRTEAVDFVPFGLARVAGVVAPPEETVAVVCVGEHTTSVVVTVSGIPRFSRLIPVDLVTGPATEANSQVTPQAAVGGLPPARRALDQTAQAAVDPVVQDLVTRLRNTLSFYASRPGTAPITTLYLTGPGVMLPGLVQSTTMALSSKVFTVDAGNVVAVGKDRPPSGPFALSLVSTLGVVLGEEK